MFNLDNWKVHMEEMRNSPIHKSEFYFIYLHYAAVT